MPIHRRVETPLRLPTCLIMFNVLCVARKKCRILLDPVVFRFSEIHLNSEYMLIIINNHKVLISNQYLINFITFINTNQTQNQPQHQI